MNKALVSIESVREFIIDALRRDRIMDIEQLKEYYGMSIHYYLKFIRMGMPFFTRKGKKYFLLSEVQHWFNSQNIEDFML